MMSIKLSVRAFRRRMLLVTAILFSAGSLAWQQQWVPPQVMDRLERDVQTYGSAALAKVSTIGAQSGAYPNFETASEPMRVNQAEISTVALVNSQVIENPQSEAFTAGLLQDTGGPDPIPWPNVAGRTKVVTYIVQSGDSLWGIANQFQLDIDTLRWSNPELERNPDVLAVGTELVILPVEGVYHYVEAGDSLASIASLYGVSETDVAAYPPNAFYPPLDLEVGRGVIVPFGRKDVILPKPTLATDSVFAWPLVGVVTGGFNAEHAALDIGAPYGSTVYAAGEGQVIYAAWAQDGFGYTLIIDHGDGLETWYTHLKGTLFQAGSFVSQGTPIGEVGSTGHSSGPHVHFEVRLNGERLDPSDYLTLSPR